VSQWNDQTMCNSHKLFKWSSFILSHFQLLCFFPLLSTHLKAHFAHFLAVFVASFPSYSPNKKKAPDVNWGNRQKKKIKGRKSLTVCRVRTFLMKYLKEQHRFRSVGVTDEDSIYSKHKISIRHRNIWQL